jgi:hypothetical protein
MSYLTQEEEEEEEEGRLNVFQREEVKEILKRRIETCS